MKKPVKIEFAPGAFDSFEGTQEELDNLQSEIIRLLNSGEADALATPIDIDELFEDYPEYATRIQQTMSTHRNIQ